MKFKAVILFFCFGYLTYAQQWQATNIKANINGQRFDDVFFIDENLGWAANGYFAQVFKTTDGGNNWKEQLNEENLGGNHYFRNIAFLNPDVGFLGTLNGKFYKTTDGGETWNPIENISPTPPAICGLDVVGPDMVYGCGAFFKPAYIITSTDAGLTWKNKDMSSFADALVEIKFVDENIGYAGGADDEGAIVLKTVDGGSTWSKIFNSGVSGEYVWKLQILGNNPDLIFGSIESIEPHPGQLIKSKNGGESWTSLNAPETHIQAVGFINENIGWMGGHTTGFYETTNGGETWNNLEIGSNLNRIVILDEGLAYGAGTSIYKFSDQSLGVSEVDPANSSALQITMKENPVNDLLSFQVQFKEQDNLLIELYNIRGQLMQSLDRIQIQGDMLLRNFEFDVQYLQAGVYYLNLHNNYNRESLKFIKL